MPKKLIPWRVVVVEDDDGLRAAIARVLTACGWQSHEFSSGEEFLDSSAGMDFDCLILDIHLPGMSGFDLLDAVKLGKADTHAILMTAQDELQISNRIVEAGATYLHKPFSGEALAAAVRHRLENCRPDLTLQGGV